MSSQAIGLSQIRKTQQAKPKIKRNDEEKWQRKQ
jgi:hypothetical protein